MGFTPKTLGLGNVTVCDKLALLQTRNLCFITSALIPMLPLVSWFVSCTIAATWTLLKHQMPGAWPPLPQPQSGGSFGSPSSSPQVTEMSSFISMILRCYNCPKNCRGWEFLQLGGGFGVSFPVRLIEMEDAPLPGTATSANTSHRHCPRNSKKRTIRIQRNTFKVFPAKVDDLVDSW